MRAALTRAALPLAIAFTGFAMLGVFAPTKAVVAPAAAQKLAPPSHLAFVLYEFDVRDPDAFKLYAPKVRATLREYKGEFVMREKVASLFGGSPSNLSVISFPSVEDARKWLASDELAKLREERDKIASVRTYLVEKLD